MDNTVTAEAPISSSAPLEARRQALKSSLKRSQFIVGVARAFKGLIGDVRVMVWVARRRRVITDYLNSHPLKKLQLGASNNLLPGWLNTDVCVNHNSVVYLDATKPFPLASNTFDYIMSEHMIEHIPYHAAHTTLQECYRVLRPGGRVRFATPDLRVLLALHNEEKTKDQIRYIDWAVARFIPNAQECRDVLVINNFFYSWGHCFLYDQATLQHVLQTAGFSGIKFYKPGASGDSNLKNLEFHGKELQSEDINQFETIVVEASKEAEFTAQY